MHHASFDYVPREEIGDFIAVEPAMDQPRLPPPLPPARSAAEILATSVLSTQAPLVEDEVPDEEVRPTRIYIPTTETQRRALMREFAEHGAAKPLDYYIMKTHISKPTLRRLPKKIERGEDITKQKKRGRKPKYSPELLAAIASDLCSNNKTLREAHKEVILANMRALESGGELLPEVSVATMHRYVRDDDLMREVDIGPLSFTEVSVRGPAANSDENKALRIQRRQELDAYINAGYLVVFVDESHWSVGNVRTRGWGPKCQKHFRTTNIASFSLSCICSISASGDRYCKIFNSTINGEIFTAYMKLLIELYCQDNENVVFVMDNARIHKPEIVELARTKGCAVLFNAPYSPECNPIELIFGIWKTRVGKLRNVDIADLLTNIADCFETISPCEVRKSIAHFMNYVTRLVLTNQDIKSTLVLNSIFCLVSKTHPVKRDIIGNSKI